MPPKWNLCQSKKDSNKMGQQLESNSKSDDQFGFWLINDVDLKKLTKLWLNQPIFNIF